MKFALIDVGAKQFMIRYYFYSESICYDPIRFDSIRLNTNAKLIHVLSASVSVPLRVCM